MRQPLVASLAALCLSALQAQAATLAATPANLAERIKAARPGDVVAYGPGTYPQLVLAGVAKAAPGVTIRPAPGVPGVLTGLKFNKVSGITVRDCRIDIDAAPQQAVELRNVSAVTVEGCEISGPVVAQTGLNTVMQAFLVKHGKGVVIRDNDIHDVRIGVGFAVVDGLTVEGNRIHDIAGDAIRGSGVNVQILRNRGWNLFKWNEDHLDFIQFSTTPGWNEGITPAHIRIEGNDFRRGKGHHAQGVFMRGSAELGYEDVVIRGNGLLGTNFNGIYVTFGKDVRIEDNFVQGEAGGNDFRISLADSTGELVVRGNRSSAQRLLQGRNAKAPVEKDNAFLIPKAAAGDTAALDAWWARKGSPPPGKSRR